MQISDDYEAGQVISKALTFVTIPENLKDSILYLDSLFDEVQYIPLATDSSSIIGQIDKLYFTEDRVIVVDKMKSHAVFVFDRAGSFLHKIDHQGRGPNEYIEIRDVCFDDDQRLIVLYDDRTDQVFYYSLDGTLVKQHKVGFLFTSFEYHGDEVFVHTQLDQANPHIPELYGRELIFTKDNQTLLSSVRQRYSPYPLMKNYDPKSEILSTYPYFIPTFSDTLFEAKSDPYRLEGSLVIQMPEGPVKPDPTLTIEEYFDQKKIGSWQKFDGFALRAGNITYVEVRYRSHNFMYTAPAFYHLESRELKAGHIVVYRNLPDMDVFEPPRFTDKEWFVSVLEPNRLLEAEERRNAVGSKELNSNSVKLAELREKITEFSNPVLMLYK